MWFVRLALRRPYTFVVMALLIVVLGLVTISRMSTDIFPNINIPVVSVIWTYPGLSPSQMEKRIVTINERAMTTTVNNIKQIESQSITGVAVIKVYFHQGTNIGGAVAQITAISQTLLRLMPPGITPPLIIQYNAANVPILQLALSSNKLSQQKIFDLALNFIRGQLATVQGAQLPLPYGGKSPEVMVQIDPRKLYAYGLSPLDVSNAINAQNLVLPSGDAKMGKQDYTVRLNSSPSVLKELNNLPIKTVHGTTVYIKDVAHVYSGFAVQTSMVHTNGHRAAMLTVLKAGNASTLNIVRRVKAALPRIQATLPKSLHITQLFDQSIFVKNSIYGVVREGLIAGVLTALMILLFLGSWRSTLIVALSIPLSILTSIVILYFLGQTLNIMTLGGMALAVGILVDDATVAIENIHRNLHEGKNLTRAILDGSQQIAVPAFVSTLSICIVFVPVVFLHGAAQSLFVPLAMAVVFAMLASYVLSRTLVPTMIHYLLESEAEMYGGHTDPKYVHTHGEPRKKKKGWLWRFHDKFDNLFERFRNTYGAVLAWCLEHRALVAALFAFFVIGSCFLYPYEGRNFFPSVDAGEFELHAMCPPGTRIEVTEKRFLQVEHTIRQVIPDRQIKVILDNIGIPAGGINLAFGNSATISPADGDILVALKKNHGPTAEYVAKLRRVLRREYPDMTFFFEPADIVSQILNAGLPAPVDIQIRGSVFTAKQDYALAQKIQRQVSEIPGAVDVNIHQIMGGPELRVHVNRTLADQLGVTQRAVANSLLISLASSEQAAPNYWLNPKNGVNYQVAVQTPQYRIHSIRNLKNTPIVPGAGGPPQLLRNIAAIKHGSVPLNINHFDVQPVYDVYAAPQGTDLGSLYSGVQRVLKRLKKDVPKGTLVTVRGQVRSMNSSFVGLAYGLIFAVVLVYAIMVINFQSWLDPLIILMALPGAMAGILWMLYATHTAISVPSLMGAIMSIGVATANSILVVTFANDQRAAGYNAHDAALSAGMTRLRPVIMTAFAMIIGMLPMALSGTENAPLGLAVIGGLAVATFATLLFVPLVYSALRHKAPVLEIEEELR